MNNWKGKYRQLPIQSQFLLLFLLLILSFIVCYCIGMIPVLFTDSSDLGAINAQNVGSFKWLQTWSSIGVFILPSVLFIYLTELKFVISRSFSRNQLAISICAMLFCIPIINYLAVWNQGIHLPQFLSGVENWMRASEAKSAVLMEYFLRMDSYGDLFVNLFVIALVPAIGEELFFRGILQKICIGIFKNNITGIGVTSLVFGMLHFQIENLLSIIFASILLGLIYDYSKNILLTILLHFGFNFFSLLSMQGLKMELISENNLEIFSNYVMIPTGMGMLTYLIIKKIFWKKDLFFSVD